MASSSKKRTTMAKIARENKLRERRVEKQARKDARRSAATDAPLDAEERGLTRADDAAAQPEPANARSET
jgi:hypothetical protein